MAAPPLGPRANAAALVLIGATWCTGVARAEPPLLPDTIEVIGTSPLGSGVDARRIAANVQVVSADDLREQGALDLADFMRRNLSGVFVNDAQSNPLQPDVQYRGFVGSPLLGLPQGLAIYQDGVRVNEPFGDTVNWALIPESAIERVAVLPGASPLFGLNALGGVVAIETKSGLTSPGTRAEISGGSFDRLALQAETGGSSDELGYFLTGSLLDENGWRDFSSTKAKQLFAKLSTHGESSNVDVAFAYADTDLVGNGALPTQLLAIDRDAVFTHPDETANALHMLSVRGEQRIGNATITGNLYWRGSDIDTLNGDESDFEECLATPGFLCDFDGGEQVLLDATGQPIAADDALEGATVNRTSTKQSGDGFSLQAALSRGREARESLVTVGVTHDASTVAYVSSTELGALDGSRLAVGGGVWLGDARVDVAAHIGSTGVFVADTTSLTERLTLTVSARYHRTRIALEDGLGDALTGTHEFKRLNPAIGVTFAPRDGLALYASLSEASRAPSPVELTCADEDDPCRLPNAFVSDPPLEQVVARSFEAGVRGTTPRGAWHLGVFRATNHDDIVFVSAGAPTNEGFFENVGKTRREGLEARVAGELGERVQWFLDVTRLSATFREPFAVPSPNHPLAVGGEIPVQPGDRLPLVPDYLVKAGLKARLGPRLSIGADVVASGGQPYRGDEGSLLDEVAGYEVVNARVEWQLGEHASVFANIDNLLDERYATFGVLGAPSGVLGPAFDDPRFLGPGSPRAAWIGVRLSF